MQREEIEDEDKENKDNAKRQNRIREKPAAKINNKETESEPDGIFSIANIVLFGVLALLLAAAANIFFGILGFLIVIFTAGGFVAMIISIYTVLAPNNWFFTSVREGTAKMIMAGTETDAKFVKAIMNFRGYKFDKDWNIVEGSDGWHPLPGIRFIGIPGIHWVYKYNFSWTSLSYKDSVEGAPKPEVKEIDYITVKWDGYFTKLKEAEAGDSMVPIDVDLLVTLRPKNPYKALFNVQNWLELVLNKVKVPVRDIIAGEKNPEDFVKEKVSLGKFMYGELDKVNSINYFRDTVGVEIAENGVETPDIDLKDLQDLATRKWQAEKEGEAEVVKQTKEGEAYKAKRGLQKAADVDYLDGVYNKINEFGDTGLTLRFLDSLIEAAKGPSNTIIPFGFMQNIAQQILGREAGGSTASILAAALGEDITKEDVKDLKEYLKEARKKRQK